MHKTELFSKEYYLASLAEWENEKETNAYGMQHVATRMIQIIKKELNRYFPEEF